jgi:phage shock protein E
MKRLLVVLLVTAVILSLGCTEAKTPIIADINTQDASAMIEENPDLIIIDVRTSEEFAQGYIENAINLDYRSDTFRDELDNLDKDKTYLIYCAVGGRSRSALDIMEELGFMEAYNMLGGINQWKKDGLPITE